MIFGMFATAAAFADVTSSSALEAVDTKTVENASGYVSLGVGPFPIPLPVFGLGGRIQKGHHGFDGSAQVVRIPSVTILKENLSYLYYFNPNLASQLYMGVGVSVAEVFAGKTGVALAPQFTVGKEYTNETGGRRFLQIGIDFPYFDLTHYTNYERRHMSSDSRIGKTPVVVLSYGICF